MPIQQLDINRQKKEQPKFGESFANAIMSMQAQKANDEAMTRENEAIKRETGIDLSGVKDPKIRQQAVQMYGQAKNKENEINFKNEQRRKLLDDIRGNRNQSQQQGQKLAGIGQSEQSMDMPNLVMNDQIDQRETPEFYRNVAEQYAALNEHDLAMVNERKATALEKDQREKTKAQNKFISDAKKETLPLRKDIADKAKYARQGIDNKKLASSLLKTGKVDTPETVYFASLLPGALGNKLLSKETQLYKSGLFDEFGVLKTMFPGQIRVKEIELLEDKLATLDKSHEAKQAILETGAKKLERDIILSKAAAKVERENPGLGVLEFEERMYEAAQPELDNLLNEIITDYENVYLDYAPKISNYVDQNGNKYRDVKKSDLKSLFNEAKSQGLELRPI